MGARMTFMGNCIIENASVIPCTSMDSAPEVGIQFHDHVVGLKDINFNGNNSKGPTTNSDKGGGYNQIQKKIYRYSPGIVRSKISGPMYLYDVINKVNIYDLIEKAITGNTIEVMDFIYLGGENIKGHRIKESLIENLDISLSAGEVANFSMGTVSKTLSYDEEFETQSIGCVKLLTWDKCWITSVLEGDVQAFNLSIKNTIIPIYTSQESTGEYLQYIPPTYLRLGMQEVTGTISTYGFDTYKVGESTITFQLGESVWSFNAIYNPTKSQASGGSDPYISSTSFTGVGGSTGPVWIPPEDGNI